MRKRNLFHQIHLSYRVQGFTLIEALVVVAMLGVLTALAAPSFSAFVDRYRVNAAREELIGTLNFARTEAIRTGQPVVLVRRTGCSAPLANDSDWDCGWRAFVDANDNNTADAGEPFIRDTQEPQGVSVSHEQGGTTNLQINRFGMLNSQRFVLSPRSIGPTSPGTLSICVTAGGRARTVKGNPAC